MYLGLYFFHGTTLSSSVRQCGTLFINAEKNTENAALMLMSKGIQKGYKGIQLVIEAGPHGRRVLVKGW